MQNAGTKDRNIRVRCKMNELYLLFEGSIVGRFIPDENLRLDFLYDESWLKKSDSFAISISLPLQKDSHKYPKPNIFLENLLPEEKIRANVERAFQIPVDSPYQFLKEFGEDLAGAFVISSNHAKIRYNTKKVPLPLSFVDRAIDEGLNLYQAVAHEYGAKFSLAGAQDKFCAIYQDENLYLSKGGLPSTYIAKINLDFRNSQTVYNEYFCMKLAKKIGLNVPSVLLIGGKYPILLVERYDRKNQGGRIHRIHQEDFCQAQSFPSGLKYEDKGGPSAVQNFSLIKNHSIQPIKDLESYLDWIAFNLIIGNNDGHSKNLSFLYQNSKCTLAPFYDLLSTAVYGNRFSKSFAFNIGGTFRYDEIRNHHIELFEKSIGVNRGKFLKNFSRVVYAVEHHKAGILRQLKTLHPKSTIGDRISKLISQRLKHFRIGGGLNL